MVNVTFFLSFLVAEWKSDDSNAAKISRNGMWWFSVLLIRMLDKNWTNLKYHFKFVQFCYMVLMFN